MKIEKLKLKIEQEIENADIDETDIFELGYIKALKDVLHHLNSTDHFEGFKRILEYHKQELDNFRDKTTTSTADLAEKVGATKNIFGSILQNTIYIKENTDKKVWVKPTTQTIQKKEQEYMDNDVEVPEINRIIPKKKLQPRVLAAENQENAFKPQTFELEPTNDLKYQPKFDYIEAGTSNYKSQYKELILKQKLMRSVDILPKGEKIMSNFNYKGLADDLINYIIETRDVKSAIRTLLDMGYTPHDITRELNFDWEDVRLEMENTNQGLHENTYTMNLYDLELAKDLIAEEELKREGSLQSVLAAEIGIKEDWLMTSAYIYEQGEFLRILGPDETQSILDMIDSGIVSINSLRGSSYGTPTLRITFRDGSFKEYDVYYKARFSKE